MHELPLSAYDRSRGGPVSHGPGIGFVRNSERMDSPRDIGRRGVLRLAAPLVLLGIPSRGADQTALLFGTVFKGSYLALPGAKIVAYDEANPRKKYRAVTNYRGEYRIHLPAGDATYVITASASGFEAATRTAAVYGMDKTTANLVLRSRKEARAAQRRAEGE